MMEKIDGGNFDEIEKIITPRNFQKIESNYLRVAMEVWIPIGDGSNQFQQFQQTVHQTAMLW